MTKTWGFLTLLHYTPFSFNKRVDFLWNQRSKLWWRTNSKKHQRASLFFVWSWMVFWFLIIIIFLCFSFFFSFACLLLIIFWLHLLIHFFTKLGNSTAEASQICSSTNHGGSWFSWCLCLNLNINGKYSNPHWKLKQTILVLFATSESILHGFS